MQAFIVVLIERAISRSAIRDWKPPLHELEGRLLIENDIGATDAHVYRHSYRGHDRDNHLY